jgi:membrane protein implicated in regulation of membrane protease activity
MEALYLGCLVGGVLFALVTVILGDLVSNALDGLLDFMSVDFLKPTVVASAVTVFGGAGILLTRYSGLNNALNMLFAILSAIFISMIVFYLYVKPMENSENSTGYSIQDLIGRIGEITISLPALGYGEVMVKVGAGNVLHIAVSLEQQELSAGTRVVIVSEVDGVLYVTEFENRKGDDV